MLSFPFRCVEHLLKHKADPKIVDSQGFTAIHYAVAGGNLAGLENLLHAVGSSFLLFGDNMPKITPLHLAVRTNYDFRCAVLISFCPLFSCLEGYQTKNLKGTMILKKKGDNCKARH